MADGSRTKNGTENSSNPEISLYPDSEDDEEMALDLIGLEEFESLFDCEDDFTNFEGFNEEFEPSGDQKSDDNIEDEGGAGPSSRPDPLPEKNAPDGFDMSNWRQGDTNKMKEFQFTGKPGINIEIPDDADELFFFKLFCSEEIIDSLTLETNMYAFDFMNSNKEKLKKHSNFRLQVVKQLIESAAPDLTPPTQNRPSSSGLELQRLSGRHFPRKIEGDTKTRISRSCKVCVPAERSMDIAIGQKRKRPGRESSYECAQCEVALCVAPCFGLYHTHKLYENAYKTWKTASE